MSAPASARDVVVVGASAGGLEAIFHLLGKLPDDLPAAIAIVLHRSPTFESQLPELLARRTRVAVREPRDGDHFERGVVHLAPRDLHMTLEEGRVRLIRGPKEHFTRPAIDPLFRSAATDYGPRVIGILLSGGGTDGVSGSTAIKGLGGFTMVQAPAEARVPTLPRSAIRLDHVDLVAPVAQLTTALLALVSGDPSLVPGQDIRPRDAS